MLRVGLTGGLGSGKSTVAQMLRELGAEVIESDELGRDADGTGPGSRSMRLSACLATEFSCRMAGSIAHGLPNSPSGAAA